jgi:hypothetical protein
MEVSMRRQQLRIVGSGRSTKLRVPGELEREPLTGLCESARVAGALDKLQRHLVWQARAAGKSWTEIGTALGITKQSAWQRFATPED